MRKLAGAMFFILLGFTFGYMIKKEPAINKFENQYNIIRIPILNSCIDLAEAIESPNILYNESVKFDMKIKNQNVNAFLKIKYRGSVAEILSEVHQYLIGCVPNIEVKYENISVFRRDINQLFEDSKVTHISINIEDGKATALFNKPK